ncbi:hypothetical protein [Sneathia sanguinegens]|uniref:hypothetical protein n=1 Tax=Sneathia sanguinegens TaxID=40543 RepID=UPI002913EAF5|nr:hypothetical protein [Sneathia sanguinegens]MDU7497227.1 hypothetical protein [Sneathia sanguinegens]
MHGNVEAFNKNQYEINNNKFSAKETGINAEVEVLGFKLGAHLVAQDNFTHYTSSNVYIKYTTPAYKGITGDFKGEISLGTKAELGAKINYEIAKDLELSFDSTFNIGINGKTLEYKNVLTDENVRIEKNKDTKLFAHSYVIEAKYTKDNLKVIGDLLFQHVNERYEEKRQDKIADVDAEIEQLKKKKELLENNKVLREKFNVSKEEFEKSNVTEEEINKIKEEYNKKENELKAKSAEKQSKQEEVDKLEKEIKPLEDGLNEKIKNEQESEATAKKAFETADNEYKAAKQKEQQAFTELKQLQQENQKYNVDELTKERAKKEKEKEPYKNHINEYQGKVTNLKNKIKEEIKKKIEEICTGLQSEEIKSKIKTLEETINNNEGKTQEKIDEFLSKNVDLIIKEKDLGNKLKKFASEINGKEVTLKTVSDILKNDENTIKRLDNEIKEIDAKIAKVNENKQALNTKQQKYTDLKKLLDEKQADKTKKEAEYNKKKVAREDVEKTYDKIAELKDKRAELEAAKTKLASLENEETTLRNERDNTLRKKSAFEKKMTDKNTKEATYNQNKQNLNDNETKLKKEVFTGEIKAEDVEKKLNEINAEIEKKENNKDQDKEVLEKNPYKMEENTVYFGAKLGVEYTYKNLGVEGKLTLGTAYKSVKKDKEKVESKFMPYAKLNGKINYNFEVKKNIFIVPELSGQVTADKLTTSDLNIKYSLTPKVAFKCTPVNNLLISADL